MLKYIRPTREQYEVIRALRQASKKAGLFRMDARARFKNA
jgi:hypothetical protein